MADIVPVCVCSCAQGVGGSGKQSLTRFASFISETQCVSIELTRIYGLPEFREDIKKLYRFETLSQSVIWGG